MEFFEKLQQLRRNVGLTQDEFSARIGVSRQLISKWESGTAYPDLNNLQSVCLFFSVSPDGLLNPNVEVVRVTEEKVRFDISSLGNNLKRIRSAKGISQEVFADALGVTRQSVSNWENGTILLKTEVMLQMLPILGISISDLLPCSKETTPTVEAVAASEEEPTEVDAPVGELAKVNVPTHEVPVPTQKRRTLRRALSISAVAVCLVLAILLTTVYVNRPTEIQMPDEALLAEIKEDYYCIFRNTNDYDPEKSVQMTCYGIYSGCVIGFLSLSDAPILPASSYEEVADVYFNYNTVTSMSVWKDGYFYSLREAYDRGYLSKKDIYALADQFYKGKEDTREHTEFYNNYRKD